MLIYAAGVNHRTAPVEVRERLHLSSEEIADFLASYGKQHFRETAILSTCNRTELYALSDEHHIDGNFLIDVLRELRPNQSLKDEHFFQFFTCGAVSHLYKVAASIDSQVLGDVQILGQVKDAFELASKTGSIGNVFHHMFTGALHAGKRILTETTLGIGAVSISFAAVELARKIFSDLPRKRALIIGAGETSVLDDRHLVSKGIDHINITNRKRENALPFAEEFKARMLPFDEFRSSIADFDIIVSATASPDTVLRHADIASAMKKRQSRPLLILDLAVPRDVDPAVNDIANVFLKDLDSIQGIVDKNLETRQKEIPKVETIVTEEVVSFFLWYNALGATPTIQQLREKFEGIRQAEFDLFRNKIDDNAHEAVEMLTKRIVNKLLHPTLVSMKKPAEDSSELDNRIQLVRDLFDLGEINDSGDQS